MNEYIVSIIWTFFDEMELACELSTEKDSVECFTVGFDGENGEIIMRVYVMTDRDMYQIIGQRKTFVPESNRDAAIRAIIPFQDGLSGIFQRFIFENKEHTFSIVCISASLRILSVFSITSNLIPLSPLG